MSLTYDIEQEPRSGDYRALLTAGLKICDRCLLVVREPSWLDAAGEKILHDMRPYLVSDTRLSEWPGTVLMSGDARVLKYEYSADVIEVVIGATVGLYDWVAPLPEDLCLMRGDDPWLISIAHERDAFIRSGDEAEINALVRALPEVGKYLKLRG